MKNHFATLVPILCLVCLVSCKTTMYVSNTVNAPLLHQKGEVKINITQNDLQLAAAVGDHVGLMANGFYMGLKDQGIYDHHGGLVEIGAGYFSNSSSRFVFETYGGVGMGNVYKRQRFTDDAGNNYMASFNAEAAKVFVQPDFGYRSDFFDAVFTPRVSFIKYYEFKQTNYSTEELQSDHLDQNKLTGPVFAFAEPAITLRGGYRYFKFQAQYGLTFNMTGNAIRHNDNFTTLGICIDIAKWYDN